MAEFGEREVVIKRTFDAPQMLSGMEAGWSQSFDKLAEFLSQTR